MDWILKMFADVVGYVAERKGRSWAALVVLCGVGFYGAYYLAFVPRDVAYPEVGRAGQYQHQLAYLIGALAQSPPDLSGARGGLYGSTIAVLSRSDFPAFTKKLRYYLHRAAGDRSLFHVITVGGTEVYDIDEPLLDASRRLQLSGEGNIEIAIVAPSTISDQTRQTLEKRGLRVRLIDAP